MQTPPHDPSAEASVVAACILTPELIPYIIAMVKPEMLYKPAHQRIFETVLELHEQSKPIDQITVVDALLGDRSRNMQDVLSVCSGEVSPAHWHEHARIVMRLAEQRAFLKSAEFISNMAVEGVEGIAALAEESVRKAKITIEDVVWMSAAEAFLKALDEQGGEKRMITTGYTDIDFKLGGGMSGGQLIVLAARPSVGKSALALNVGIKAARSGAKVAFISLEMTPESLSLRVMSSLTGVCLSDIRAGREISSEALGRALETMHAVPLCICSRTSLSVSDIRSECARLLEGVDQRLIIIDYLQLITPPGRKSESRQVEVSQMSRQLKLLALELDCPVLVLAQLNRAVESRAKKRPQLSDLRESGAIEQDADVVMFIDRPGFGEDNHDERDATLIIAKNRQGATGEVSLIWDAPHVRFQGLARKTELEVAL